MFGFKTRIVGALSRCDRDEVAALLASAGLSFDEGADATALVEDMDGRLGATASLFKDVIRMVAVASCHRESGLAAAAISGLMEISRSKGPSRLFLFTKPDTACMFESLGFRLIAGTNEASLLESGEPGITAYRGYLARQGEFSPPQKDGRGAKTGAIVANCNPFTLGHRHLVEHASRSCLRLFVIIVEEDGSRYSFEDRFEMARLGIADIENADLLHSGPYAVSSATFPTYFLKDKSDAAASRIQARLDLDLFLRVFVPSLGINARFVGTEPNSPVTNLYNEAMREVLPPAGVEVEEVERLASPYGNPVSASVARSLIDMRETAKLPSYLPKSTISYLEGRGLI
jgi:[citrate (pro-3S)-lyase] ligase